MKWKLKNYAGERMERTWQQSVKFTKSVAGLGKDEGYGIKKTWFKFWLLLSGRLEPSYLVFSIPV